MNCVEEVLTNADMFTDNWLNAYERINRYSWAIQLKETGEVIGRYFGMKVIEFFFEEVGFNRIYAWHAKENPASGRMQQKSGMKWEGTLRQAGKCNFGICDKVIYAILAEDYFSEK